MCLIGWEPAIASTTKAVYQSKVKNPKEVGSDSVKEEEGEGEG